MGRPKLNETANVQETATATLTPEERSIVERVSNQDTEWFGLTESDLNDFSLANNPLNISNYPVAAKLEREKKFVFRWCERTPGRVDALTRSAQPPLRWAIVNRQTLPEMSEYVDPVLGCVCCLDQLLLFKPYAHAMMVKKSKNELSEAKANSPQQRLQNADKVQVGQGQNFQIRGSDLITYEDNREDSTPFAIDE